MLVNPSFSIIIRTKSILLFSYIISIHTGINVQTNLALMIVYLITLGSDLRHFEINEKIS
jgi:hypothetical protein